MTRITENKDGYFRECKLCPGRLSPGRESLVHVRTHGSELGKTLIHPYTVKGVLKKWEMNTTNPSYICCLCYSEFSTPAGLTYHRAREHNDFYSKPLICEYCVQPLFTDSFEQHFLSNHMTSCCGEKLISIGEIWHHMMKAHPRKLEQIFSYVDLSSFYYTTCFNHYRIDLPWPLESRIFSSVFDIDKRIPKPHTKEFREFWQVKQFQTAIQDQLYPEIKLWKVRFTKFDPRNIPDITNKLLMVNIATSCRNFLNNCIYTSEDPFKTEIITGDKNSGWCGKCKDEISHKENDPQCVDRDTLEPITQHLKSNKLEDQYLNLFMGVIIGSKHHHLGTAPVGQFKLVNLGITCWNPLYPTGYSGDQAVFFMDDGHHLKLKQEENYFDHIYAMTSLLPKNYNKPIFLEVFIPEEIDHSEELIEAAIAAYFENVKNLRCRRPNIYILLGPAIKVPTKVTKQSYHEAATRNDWINRMLSTFSLKFQIPFIPLECFVNKKQMKLDDTFWMYPISSHNEPLFNKNNRPTREFLRRLGVITDIVIESYQKTLVTLSKYSVRHRKNKHRGEIENAIESISSSDVSDKTSSCSQNSDRGHPFALSSSNTATHEPMSLAQEAQGSEPMPQTAATAATM